MKMKERRESNYCVVHSNLIIDESVYRDKKSSTLKSSEAKARVGTLIYYYIYRDIERYEQGGGASHLRTAQW